MTKRINGLAIKSLASKACEENVFRERIALSLIQQQASTKISAYNLEQVMDWNNIKIQKNKIIMIKFNLINKIKK